LTNINDKILLCYHYWYSARLKLQEPESNVEYSTSPAIRFIYIYEGKAYYHPSEEISKYNCSKFHW